MNSGDIGAMLNELGRILVEEAKLSPGGTLLYAQVGTNFLGVSIFEDRGNHILYHHPNYDLFQDLLMDMWEAEEPGKRWAEIEFVLRDGKFNAAFTYPEEIDPEEDSFDRRDQVVARYFGEKPIIYPPWPETDEGWQFEL